MSDFDETTLEDEHAGKGGSYILDVKTGKRTLVERTDDAPVNMTPAAPGEPAPASTASAKPAK